MAMRSLLLAVLLVGCGESFVADGAGGSSGEVQGNTPDAVGGTNGSGAPDGSGGTSGDGTGGQTASGSGQNSGSGGSTLCQPGVCGVGSEARRKYCAVESKGNVNVGDCVLCEKKWYNCNENGADGCEVKSSEGHPCPGGDGDDDDD